MGRKVRMMTFFFEESDFDDNFCCCRNLLRVTSFGVSGLIIWFVTELKRVRNWEIVAVFGYG